MIPRSKTQSKPVSQNVQNSFERLVFVLDPRPVGINALKDFTRALTGHSASNTVRNNLKPASSHQCGTRPSPENTP